MKTFINIIKAVLFICISFIGILIILLNSTFGNYSDSAYDLLLNPFLFIIYFIFSLIFINWTKEQFKKKYFPFLLLPLIFTIVSYLWQQNFHKNIYLHAIMEESKGSLLTLFDNNTFEIKVQYQHGADYKKGNYERKGNEIFLKEDAIVELTDSLFTQNYYIVNNEKLIVSNNNKFKPLTILKIKETR
ncbi:copper resistance protein NlpE [Flavobacterium jejuense]|uniref:Copper resistance protein NlpE n=1 Tax=Flavobacterium jejuense TaxID=1544455 RepID=A0ABX0ITH7_9FLAO|nr:copper resistance protein NlpE [Flavobacterium jejuense]NHN26112.1 copper resistance protein NlpE [Flavobacterium jejuense]